MSRIIFIDVMKKKQIFEFSKFHEQLFPSSPLKAKNFEETLEIERNDKNNFINSIEYLEKIITYSQNETCRSQKIMSIMF